MEIMSEKEVRTVHQGESWAGIANRMMNTRIFAPGCGAPQKHDFFTYKMDFFAGESSWAWPSTVYTAS